MMQPVFSAMALLDPLLPDSDLPLQTNATSGTVSMPLKMVGPPFSCQMFAPQSLKSSVTAIDFPESIVCVFLVDSDAYLVHFEAVMKFFS